MNFSLSQQIYLGINKKWNLLNFNAFFRSLFCNDIMTQHFLHQVWYFTRSEKIYDNELGQCRKNLFELQKSINPKILKHKVFHNCLINSINLKIKWISLFCKMDSSFESCVEYPFSSAASQNLSFYHIFSHLCKIGFNKENQTIDLNKNIDLTDAKTIPLFQLPSFWSCSWKFDKNQFSNNKSIFEHFFQRNSIGIQCYIDQFVS